MSFSQMGSDHSYAPSPPRKSEQKVQNPALPAPQRTKAVPRWLFFNKYIETGFNFVSTMDISYPYKMELTDMENMLLFYEDQCKSIPEMYRAMIY